MDQWNSIFDEFNKSLNNVTFIHLNDLIKLSLDIEIRESCTLEQINFIKSIIYSFTADMDDPSSPINQADIEKLISAVKLLRNLCAHVEANQSIMRDNCFVKEVVRLLSWRMNLTSAEMESCNLQVACLQLIGNICSGHSHGQDVAWQLCYPEVLNLLLSHEVYRVSNLCFMVVFNCVKSNHTRTMELVTCTPGMIGIALKCLRSESVAGELEWIILFSEEVIRQVPLKVICGNISLCDKTMLFEFILAYSDDANTIDEINFTTNCNTFLSFWSSHSNLLFLQENFKELTKTLLSKENLLLSLYSALPSHNPESEELIKAFLAMLSLLCQLSCYVNMLELLQKDAALFQCSIDILSVLSDIDGSSTSGKHRSYLSSSGTYDDKTAAAHPLFGVKRDIVRLIGNLCYRCSQNQDLVHDFMPLLLNQCSIDHSNPFIMQWALWAIRNVCENNPANQLLIRQIEHKGVHDIDEIQRNLGCEVEIASNGKLRIKK